MDGTERPVQRPQDNEKQKEYYSGKKKRHTSKHITGSTNEKRVIYLSKARGGKIHDKKQLDQQFQIQNVAKNTKKLKVSTGKDFAIKNSN